MSKEQDQKDLESLAQYHTLRKNLKGLSKNELIRVVLELTGEILKSNDLNMALNARLKKYEGSTNEKDVTGPSSSPA